jgi:ribosomal protein S18 acetylase RimI-like enzyme
METQEEIEIREFRSEDYDRAFNLWEVTENLCLGEASKREAINSYLKRNPLVSSVAECQRKIVGTILAGHDGYRAHIKFLAVAKEYRNRKLASRMINRSFEMLKLENVKLIYLSVKDHDPDVLAFWSNFGFKDYEKQYPNVSLLCMGI